MHLVKEIFQNFHKYRILPHFNCGALGDNNYGWMPILWFHYDGYYHELVRLYLSKLLI